MTKTLPAFRITLDNGSAYITSMAIGVTLEQARAYFLGQRLVQRDEKSFRTVVNVEKI